MEENTFRIKKSYIYAALGVLLVFGFFMYSLVLKDNNYPVRTQVTGMVNENSMNQNSNSMADHHKPVQSNSNGFFENAIGKTAPEFELQDIEGTTFKLSDYKGKNVVLFFNEGSMCYPACWNQIAELSKDGRLNSDDTVAFSIVVDSSAQWQKIIQKAPQMSKSKILFDTAKKTVSDYDVLFTASSMHKGSYPGHTYFIIDKEGIIRYTKDDPSMAIRNDELAAELGKL